MVKINEQNCILNKNFIFKKQEKNNTPSFKGELKGAAKFADIFIKSQENLSSTRFIQDTATNWVPKAIFSRSIADFAEMSFLEFIESAIFYFAPPLLGEKLFRNKIFKNILPKNISKNVNELIPKSLIELEKNKLIAANVKKRTISTKAGIILACSAIPTAEYTLSFAKNLFTLKTFNKSNFNNIANLDKNGNEKENLDQQKKVETNSVNQLKKAAIISASGVGLGLGLAHFGYKSNFLQKISKAVISPGMAISGLLKKAGVNNKNILNTIGKFSLDFSNNNGKLALSKGQLALTAIIGLFGYSKAAEDRGKLDVLEVWTRVPLVVFYTIFGSELFQKGFEKILEKRNQFPDLLKKNKKGQLVSPKRDELPKLAEKLAKEKGTDKLKELTRLIKEKAVVEGIPYAFSLIFMGLTLSAITRFWTQYRYDNQNNNISKHEK